MTGDVILWVASCTALADENLCLLALTCPILSLRRGGEGGGDVEALRNDQHFHFGFSEKGWSVVTSFLLPRLLKAIDFVSKL